MRAVHKRISRHGILCGYRRWGCMVLTSSLGWRLVTCKRCLAMKDKQ